MYSKSTLAWCIPVFSIIIGLGFIIYDSDSDLVCMLAYFLLIFGVFGLLYWAGLVDVSVSTRLSVPVLSNSDRSNLIKDMEARIREAAEFKTELEAKRAEIAALKSGLNRTDAIELNDAIAQLYVAFEFERGRAAGEFAQVLTGLSEPVEGLFSVAALVKGVPIPGERFVDQPAGSCKVFKTELTSDAALKGKIKEARSPWVGFMANGKLKIIIASNVSVYA